MKKILHKTSDRFNKRAKVIIVNEDSQDKECHTTIEKKFLYIMDPGHSRERDTEKPDITVKKSYDTVRNIERFHIKVKGTTSIEKNRQSYRVDFCHSLKINIDWNAKFLSPETSAAVA